MNPIIAVPKIHYREISLPEVINLYHGRLVVDRDSDGLFVIHPSENGNEGNVALAIPKLLPTDSHNRPVDLTRAVADEEHLIGREMGIICHDLIYARMGHIASSLLTVIPTLVLGHPRTANALRLAIYYSAPPAWGNHHIPLPRNKIPGEVISYQSKPLDEIRWVDFWLIRIGPDDFPQFREYYIRAQRDHLRFLNAYL